MLIHLVEWRLESNLNVHFSYLPVPNKGKNVIVVRNNLNLTICQSLQQDIRLNKRSQKSSMRTSVLPNRISHKTRKLFKLLMFSFYGWLEDSIYSKSIRYHFVTEDSMVCIRIHNFDSLLKVWKCRQNSESMQIFEQKIIKIINTHLSMSLDHPEVNVSSDDSIRGSSAKANELIDTISKSTKGTLILTLLMAILTIFGHWLMEFQ